MPEKKVSRQNELAHEFKAMLDEGFDPRDPKAYFDKMLKDEGQPPTGKWADLEALLPVRDFKARHASTLLTFDAVVDAVNQIEAKSGLRAS